MISAFSILNKVKLFKETKSIHTLLLIKPLKWINEKLVRKRQVNIRNKINYAID